MKKVRSIIALSIIVFIPFGLMIWFRNHQTSGFTSSEMIIYPLLFGSMSIVVLYVLKKYFLKEDLSDFNSKKATWINDIGWGLMLTLVYFALFFIERSTLTEFLRFVPNMELLGVMLDLRNDPVLLMIWFGPVLWIGVALYEELIRVFMLTNLWKWSKNKIWIVCVIVLSALIFGFVHWSQGPYGIITIGVKSLVSGWFFYKKRRLMPLIYAHVLYDGLQVATLLLTYPE